MCAFRFRASVFRVLSARGLSRDLVELSTLLGVLYPGVGTTMSETCRGRYERREGPVWQHIRRVGVSLCAASGMSALSLMEAFPPGDENAMTVIRRNLMFRSEERH